MNFYAAINQLVARLARLSRKRKTRFEKRKRRAGRLQVAARTPGLVQRKRSKKLLDRSIMSLGPQPAGT
jgi:hypothetical protein